jgi:hypothetical protein
VDYDKALENTPLIIDLGGITRSKRMDNIIRL